MSDWLEEELRSALRRENPPPGFTHRVLGRAGAQPVRRWGWAALAAAACLVLTAGLGEYRRYEGQKAKEQVMQAVRLAAGEWGKAQRKVVELGK